MLVSYSRTHPSKVYVTQSGRFYSHSSNKPGRIMDKLLYSNTIHLEAMSSISSSSSTLFTRQRPRDFFFIFRAPNFRSGRIKLNWTFQGPFRTTHRKPRSISKTGSVENRPRSGRQRRSTGVTQDICAPLQRLRLTETDIARGFHRWFESASDQFRPFYRYSHFAHMKYYDSEITSQGQRQTGGTLYMVPGHPLPLHGIAGRYFWMTRSNISLPLYLGIIAGIKTSDNSFRMAFVSVFRSVFF